MFEFITGTIIKLSLYSLMILVFIGRAFVFKKAGENPWKAIIPFYAEYTMLRLVNKKKWFYLYIISLLIGMVSICIFVFSIFGTIFNGFSILFTGQGNALFYLQGIAISAALLMLTSTGLFAERVICCIGIGEKMHLSPLMILVIILFEPAMLYIGLSEKYQWSEDIKEIPARDSDNL